MSIGLRARIWALLIAFSTAGVITLNALANILPLNGVQTGALSDGIPNLFVPAGITFSIWGIIYVLLLWFTVQSVAAAFSAKAENHAAVVSLGPPAVLSALANSAWLLAWHWSLVPLSLVFMVMLLSCLIWWYHQSRLHSKDLPGNKFRSLTLRLPISVYLGWITVATVANVTAVLVVAGLNGGENAVLLTMLTLVAVLAIALLVIWREKDIAYTAVIVWALGGIAFKRLSTGQAAEVGWVAIGIALVIVLAVVFRLVWRRRA